MLKGERQSRPVVWCMWILVLQCAVVQSGQIEEAFVFVERSKLQFLCYTWCSQQAPNERARICMPQLVFDGLNGAALVQLGGVHHAVIDLLLKKFADVLHCVARPCACALPPLQA